MPARASMARIIVIHVYCTMQLTLRAAKHWIASAGRKRRLTFCQLLLRASFRPKDALLLASVQQLDTLYCAENSTAPAYLSATRSCATTCDAPLHSPFAATDTRRRLHYQAQSHDAGHFLQLKADAFSWPCAHTLRQTNALASCAMSSRQLNLTVNLPAHNGSINSGG